MLIKFPLLKKNNFLLLFILLILITRILALFFSKLELQGDEAQYWYWSTYFEWGYYSKPPLIAWVISFFTSLFGNSVFIIKLPALIAHFTTSIVLYYLAKSFNRSDEESLWLSISYLLFFGVSLSSNIISTDPFLLLFWTLSLLCLNELNKNQSIKWIILISIFISLGIYAKYAMVYFLICCFIFIFFTKNKKIYLKNLIIIISLVILFLLPHFLWAASQGWITLSHTGENFNWGSDLFNIEHLFNFILGQFFISTPIIFYFYLKSIIDFRKSFKLYAFEICFSLPIIFLVLVQSFISRANANWSSVAFIGIAMLTVSYLFNRQKKILIVNSILGLLMIMIVSFFLIFPPNISPLNKLSGMEKAAAEIMFLDNSLGSEYIVFDDRMTIAKFLYYLPSKQHKMKIVSNNIRPDNHFAMIMPISDKNLVDKKIIYIHHYNEIPAIIKENVLVQQQYEMPNKKNNFYISYIEKLAISSGLEPETQGSKP